MIRKENIKTLLILLQFEEAGNGIFSKKYAHVLNPLKVDIKNEKIFYDDCGIEVGRETTSNFSNPENFVVLECVDRLLSKGYNSKDIELEPKWKLGHSSKSGFADIWVRTLSENKFNGNEEDKQSLIIIECKTSGNEFHGAWNDTKEDGAQLFSYFQQEPATKFLCLYTSDIIGGNVKSEYFLINVQDNEQLLSSDSAAESYRDKNDKQRYRVWKDTYNCEYATRGLFENDIQPYLIGKNKYKIGDLSEVDNYEIQKKYHEFALILRQHNVSGRENAFDKLVNLFLAKVVDETNNPDNLNFYWKGAAYDDDFQLQDRLQRLYRDGMMKFLGEEVTYIENEWIDKAFRRFKNDPDATKETIMKYFRALKFFSDNDFSFISVHNEKLFKQNAIILRKVVKMLQDIRLKNSGSKTNQFLGDLFEGFLNRGVKQSEGQFFTPMPIVRFIVSSLPLENIIKDNPDIPRAIDYACGAGHFLTEYAVRLKEYARKYRPDIPLEHYFSHITGIEKEYRLSKVSKVSAFMYQQDDINIVYADALVPNKSVKDNSYDVLVANPPYSVSGFLETLTDVQRKRFSLFDKNINIDKNNAIEAFFIERASQLMKARGVAGIILPVSILTKSGIYTHTRELILKDFDIVALAEFGSGTFGKTGTNTVVIFLRRKETNTPDAEHYKNRVESWFSKRYNADAVYQDSYLLDNYCRHCGFAVDDYKTFIEGQMTKRFNENETIKAYYTSFFGTQRNAMKDVCDEAKNIRSRFMAKSKTKNFTRISKSEQEAVTQKAFFDFVTAIEKEKLYYFILAQMVTQPVLLMKMPSSNADGKKFLGYEWSDSKGNEGIKYLNVSKAKPTNSDNEDNETDDDTIQQIRGIDGIRTPLFNPENLNDNDKINTLIRNNFNGEKISIPKDLSTYISQARLTDMIDFKRTAFTKEFRTSIISETNYQSSFSTTPLEDLLMPISGSITKIGLDEIHTVGKYPVITQEADKIISGFSDVEHPITDLPLIVFGDHSCTFKYVDYEFVRGADGTQLIKVNNQKVLPKYVYYFLSSVKIENTGKYERHFKYLKKCKIPIPPLDIQQKIVKGCEAEDKLCEEAEKKIEKIEFEIANIIKNLDGSRKRLGEIISFVSNRVAYSTIAPNSYVSTDNMLQNCKGVKPYDGQPNIDFVIVYQKGDILLSNIRPYLKKLWIADKDGGCSPDVFVMRVNNTKMFDPNFIYYSLRRNVFFDFIMTDIKGMKMPRGKKETIILYEIAIPNIEEQHAYAKRFKKMDEEIKKLKCDISNSTNRKQQILDKYLK